jgi:hypothetical protein
VFDRLTLVMEVFEGTEGTIFRDDVLSSLGAGISPRIRAVERFAGAWPPGATTG